MGVREWDKYAHHILKESRKYMGQILIGQPKATIHFQCFLNPHQFGPLLEGQINSQGIMVEGSSIE
jgi:hypothetical protein